LCGDFYGLHLIGQYEEYKYLDREKELKEINVDEV